MRWKLKKPLGNKGWQAVGGKNSVVGGLISNPLPALTGAATGGIAGGQIGLGLGEMKNNFQRKMDEYNRQSSANEAGAQSTLSELEKLAFDEESKRQALGLKQRGQINTFADETQTRATDFRKGLAQSLSDTGQQFFNRLNPQILEDLNSRGLFTSQPARDKEQTDALSDIARENESTLSRFDTDVFNQVNDIRGTGLSALLGGDQSALDSALELKKAGIQRRFDQEDSQREQAFAGMLARRQSRDGLIASLLGLGGRLGGAALGKAF